MRHTIAFLVVLLFVCDVKSDTVCDNGGPCICRNSDTELYYGDAVVCSYTEFKAISSRTLPAVVYSLDLSHTNITRVTSCALLQSHALVELLLDHNEIYEITEDALRLPGLKRLDLSDNRLDTLSEKIFARATRLEYLNLANNRFTSFTNLVFHHLSDLRELVLDNNNLGPTLERINIFDRDGFGLTHRIQNLSISGINLTAVPDNFFVDAYDLRKLVISFNHLTDIFELPFTLQYIDLSDNPIREISMEDFDDVPALRELKLNNLYIKEVPEYAFSPLKGLRVLELERNTMMTKFNPLAFGRDVLEDPDDFLLEKLSLRGSRLKSLDKMLLEPFGQLIELDLQGNPWNCDCNIAWVKNLQLNSEITEYLRCATPSSLSNRKIYSLKANALRCSIDKKQYVGITIAVITFCFILTTVAVWLFAFLPKLQSRCRHIQSLYMSSAPYTVLPMNLD